MRHVIIMISTTQIKNKIVLHAVFPEICLNLKMEIININNQKYNASFNIITNEWELPVTISRLQIINIYFSDEMFILLSHWYLLQTPLWLVTFHWYHNIFIGNIFYLFLKFLFKLHIFVHIHKYIHITYIHMHRNT